jgi:hypothetical protein
MEENILKDTLIRTLESNYNIKEPYSVENRNFDFYAEFFQRSSKYLASKKFEYYAFSTYDHLFFKSVDSVSIEFLKDLYSLTENIVDSYTKVDEEHMETYITYVINSTTPLSTEIEKFVKKNTNYVKSFSFGFNGWTKLKLIILVPTSNEVYTNKFGNRDKDVFKKVLTKYLNS